MKGVGNTGPSGEIGGETDQGCSQESTAALIPRMRLHRDQFRAVTPVIRASMESQAVHVVEVRNEGEVKGPWCLAQGQSVSWGTLDCMPEGCSTGEE